MICHAWPVGDHEVHIVPEVERMRHTPEECWCDPVIELVDDKPVFRHRLRGDDFLARAAMRA